MDLVDLIKVAPWREAVTYRDSWPHEYVLLIKDSQADLFGEICRRMCAGEGVDGSFFKLNNTYLFLGEYKYWFMTPCHKIPIASANNSEDFVLNRAKLYRDRRDFHIGPGDTHTHLAAGD